MIPRAMTITEIKLSLTTADTTGLTLNVENRAADPSASGNDILSSDLDSGADTFTASGTSMSGSYNVITEDQFVAVNVTGEGDGAAVGLKVWLLGYWT